MEVRTSEQRSESSELREEVERLRSQRVEMDRELIRRAYRIDELERELVRLDGEFRGSLSWRLTAPIRMLKLIVAKLLRR